MRKIDAWRVALIEPAAVAPALVGLLVSAEGIGSVFLMFAAVSLIGALVASLMIETRGRQLEQIAA